MLQRDRPFHSTISQVLHVQVVPEELRTSVFAFDKCLTGALGALAAPLVGVGWITVQRP